MKVYQLENTSGRAWANQFVIRFDTLNIDILQSYNSLVCLFDYNENHITLGDDWDYSNTTGRAVNKFFADNGFEGITRAEIRKALKSGEIVDDYDGVWTIGEGCADYFADFMKYGGK